MRTNSQRYRSRGDLGKSLVAAVALVFSSNFVAISQSSTLSHDGELLSLYRELKLIESESLRVAVTIDALEAELHEYPNPENTEQIHARLGRLYKYDVQLASLYIELNEVWSYLQDPERETALTRFNADQSKPIPIIQEGVYEGLPDGAIPITDYSPITKKTIYTDLRH